MRVGGTLSALFAAMPLTGLLLAGAPASPPQVGFEWDAPAGCPTSEEVEALVRDRIGVPTTESEGARLDVIARVRQAESGGWALRLWVIDDHGTHRRDVENEDCALLAQTAATMVAVFVTPSEEPKAQAEKAPQPVVSAPAPVVETNSAATPPPRNEGVRYPIGGDLRGQGHFELGTLAGPAGGFGLAANLDIGRARIEAVGRGTFAERVVIAGGGSADLRLWSAGIRGGFVPRFGRLELSLTGGLDVGALVAQAHELTRARGGVATWAAVVLSPALVFRPHPRVGMWASVEGFVALLRPKITLDDGSTVHQPAVGGGRLSLGVGIRFGVTDRPRRRPPRGSE